MLLAWRSWRDLSGYRGCWSCELILSPLGLESVHLRSQVADVSSGRLVSVTCLSPLIGQLTLGVMERSTDSAGRLAKRVARRDGGQFVIGI